MLLCLKKFLTNPKDFQESIKEKTNCAENFCIKSIPYKIQNQGDIDFTSLTLTLFYIN